MKTDKQKLKEEIFSLCSLMSVSGFEERATDALSELAGEHFDEVLHDRVGNHIFIKRCGREGAARILIDAHFDEIGFMVTEILDGGFLRICQQGGVDVAILQASEVIIYGKKKIRGVISSTPPHLKSGDDGDKLPKISELLIDTGYSKAELEKYVRGGTPVGFAEGYASLLDGRIVGRSFDNKACGAIAMSALRDTAREALAGDVYLLFSSYEETSMRGGASAGVFGVYPDYAMAVDVNLGRVPDTKKYETVEVGGGISISVCSATSMPLCSATRALCERESIPYMLYATPASTGTNATGINLVADGVPVVDIGLPLINMHTYSEIISLDDAMALYELTAAFITDTEIAGEFSRSSEEGWVEI